MTSKPLAEVAATAKSELWMIGSYSENESGHCFPLTTIKGFCCAWAAECLAHAYEPERGPNRRHSQKKFTYRYNTAHAWARALRAGGDCDKGDWHDGEHREDLQPGDMVFWMKGVNGYKYASGHAAIVTNLDGPHVMVSENSSSRGIGNHPIDQGALASMAGLMRWHVGVPPRELKVQMADSNQYVPMWMEGSRAVCNVRELAEMLGYQVHAEHLQAHGKLYLVRKGEVPDE